MPFRLRRSPKRQFRGRAARDGGAASLSDEWRTWVAENVALGVSEGDLLAALRASGVPDKIGLREIEGIRGSPLTAAAKRLARLLSRHELVARVKREAAKLASQPNEIERRDRLSREEFFDRYYAANVPVVITDALAGWPNLVHWSPLYFKERFGDVDVEVMTGRDADPACDANFEAHCATMRLGAFCDRVASAGFTNDFYLVANNRVTNRPALKPLFDDVSAPHEYLDDRRDAGWTSMWFGPAGTVTPLHHDTANVLFCQVFGRKRIRLFPAFELSLTHAMHHGVYSSIDAEHPDHETFPEFGEASMREVVLSPGEALFLPVSWWHHVRAMEVSISLAFTAFRVPNQFQWYTPGKVE
jgi:hypothetical protein